MYDCIPLVVQTKYFRKTLNRLNCQKRINININTLVYKRLVKQSKGMRVQNLILSLHGFVYVRIILAQFLLKQIITFRGNTILTK